jgi:plastocyanin
MKKLVSFASMFLKGLTILFVFISISNSCTNKAMSDYGSGSVGPGTNEVWIQSMAFNPATISVNAGTTIQWTNKDGVPHTVTSNTSLFDSGTINNNGTYSHLFSTAGTFAYHCTFHSSMTATVVVN